MILVDTSLLYAFFEPKDSHHKEARKLYLQIPKNQVLILDDVIKELLTIINQRKGSNTSKEIYKELEKDNRNVTIYNFDSLEFFDFLDFFQQQKNTKLSIVDLELIYLSQKNNFPVLTFDLEIKKALSATKLTPTHAANQV